MDNEISDHYEHFGQADARDTCHYICSSLRYTNIVILILIILLIYHFLVNYRK